MDPGGTLLKDWWAVKPDRERGEFMPRSTINRLVRMKLENDENEKVKWMRDRHFRRTAHARDSVGTGVALKKLTKEQLREEEELWEAERSRPEMDSNTYRALDVEQRRREQRGMAVFRAATMIRSVGLGAVRRFRGVNHDVGPGVILQLRQQGLLSSFESTESHVSGTGELLDGWIDARMDALPTGHGQSDASAGESFQIDIGRLVGLGQRQLRPTGHLVASMNAEQICYELQRRIFEKGPTALEEALDTITNFAKHETLAHMQCYHGIPPPIVWRDATVTAMAVRLVSDKTMHGNPNVGRAVCDLIHTCVEGYSPLANTLKQRCVDSGGLTLVLAVMYSEIIADEDAARDAAQGAAADVTDANLPDFLNASGLTEEDANMLTAVAQQQTEEEDALSSAGRAFNNFLEDKFGAVPYSGHAGDGEPDADFYGAGHTKSRSNLIERGSTKTFLAPSDSAKPAGNGGEGDNFGTWIKEATDGIGRFAADVFNIGQADDAGELRRQYEAATVAAMRALLTICSGYDEAALQRKELAIDMHVLETLLRLSEHTNRTIGKVDRSSSQSKLSLELATELQFVFWAHMQHYHAKHHDSFHSNFAYMWQAPSRRRRAELRIKIGAHQFDAICIGITKAPDLYLKPYKHATHVLAILRVLLPTITAMPGISRVGCVVRAIRAQKAIEMVETMYAGAYPDDRVQYLLGKLSLGALILHVKAHMRKLGKLHELHERRERHRQQQRIREGAARRGVEASETNELESSTPGASFADDFLHLHMANVEIEVEEALEHEPAARHGAKHPKPLQRSQSLEEAHALAAAKVRTLTRREQLEKMRAQIEARRVATSAPKGATSAPRAEPNDASLVDTEEAIIKRREHKDSRSGFSSECAVVALAGAVTNGADALAKELVGLAHFSHDPSAPSGAAGLVEQSGDSPTLVTKRKQVSPATRRVRSLAAAGVGRLGRRLSLGLTTRRSSAPARP